jgi:hypothetical protein
MSKKSKTQAHDFIMDLLAYVRFSVIEKGDSAGVTLSTVIHDLTAYERERDQDWFCPRTAGYANRAAHKNP